MNTSRPLSLIHIAADKNDRAPSSREKSSQLASRLNYSVAMFLLILAPGQVPCNSQDLSLFKDVSSLLNHQHHEEPFDDFDRQGLLHRRLSQLGPGIGWMDVSGDGRDDLIIASGKGGAIAVFEYTAPDSFKRLSLPVLTQAATRDQTTILAFPQADGRTALLVGSANYEDGLATGACVREYHLRNGTIEDLIPGQTSSIGPLALGDLPKGATRALEPEEKQALDRAMQKQSHEPASLAR